MFACRRQLLFFKVSYTSKYRCFALCNARSVKNKAETIIDSVGDIVLFVLTGPGFGLYSKSFFSWLSIKEFARGNQIDLAVALAFFFHDSFIASFCDWKSFSSLNPNYNCLLHSITRLLRFGIFGRVLHLP